MELNKENLAMVDQQLLIDYIVQLKKNIETHERVDAASRKMIRTQENLIEEQRLQIATLERIRELENG